MRPHPVPDQLTEPFWAAAAEGRLIIQKCGSCGHYDHPPFPECTRCGSVDVGFEAVSGRGTIFARTVVESPVVAGFDDEIPYTALVVELDEQEGLHMAGRLPGIVDDARIGRRVVASFDNRAGGFTLPQFDLVTNQDG